MAIVDTYNDEAICINEYIFNKNKTFDGVIFSKGFIYKCSKPKIGNLMGLYNKEYDAYVGMSIERFNKYFKLLEKKEDIEDGNK